MKNYAKILSIVTWVTACVFVGGFLFALSCVTSAGDHERGVSLLRDIESNYTFKTMRKDGHGPAVYVAGLAYGDHLSIYGDYSEQEMAAILQTISEAQSRRADKKTIYVEFGTIELDDSTTYKKAKIPR